MNTDYFCSQPDCPAKTYALGLCRIHFEAAVAAGRINDVCLIPSCSRTVWTPGADLCSNHRAQARRYSLSASQMHALVTLSAGLCFICQDRPGTLIDHDHGCCDGGSQSCGRCVRGWLCLGCNTLLGQAHDDTARLLTLHFTGRKPKHVYLRAIDYLSVKGLGTSATSLPASWYASRDALFDVRVQ